MGRERKGVKLLDVTDGTLEGGWMGMREEVGCWT